MLNRYKPLLPWAIYYLIWVMFLFTMPIEFCAILGVYFTYKWVVDYYLPFNDHAVDELIACVININTIQFMIPLLISAEAICVISGWFVGIIIGKNAENAYHEKLENE